MASWRDRPPRELGELVPMVGEAMERAAVPPAERLFEERRKRRRPVPGPSPDITGMASDTGGVPRPPDAAKEVQDWESFIPPPTGDEPGIEAFQARTSRLELPEGAGQATVLSRSPGGSGDAWVREQAGRRQGPQVFGFDASQIPPPPAKGGIQAPAADAPSKEQEEVAAATRPRPTVAQGPVEGDPWQQKPGMVAIQGDPDERDVGTWGIPQGIRRSPQPPGAQERWQREFQDTESARYRDYDINQAAQEAELAKQQTLTEDPFAEIGAETAARKELIGAEAEAQRGLFGAEAEAKEGVHKERGLQYATAAEAIQNTYNSERTKLEEAGYDEEELDRRLAELEQKTAIDMQVLQARVYGVQGMRYGGQEYGFRGI